MKKNFKNLKKNSFIKNVFIVASGTAGAQALTMLLSPIITRIYGPEAFGVMGTFSAMINIIIPIAALTYPIAIVLPKQNEEARGLMKLSIFISIILSIFSLILILLFKDQIAKLFNLTEISSYLYFIPIVIIFAGLMQIMEQWLIRTKQFSINAKATFYQAAIVNIGKIGIGMLYPVAKVLVFFTAITNGLRAIMMYLFSNKIDVLSKKSKNSTDNNLRSIAKKYYDFPIYRAPQDLLDSASQSMPVIMLTTLFSPAAAGFFTIGRTVLRLPTNLIGKAVGDVFYPRIAEAANKKENMSKLILKATLALALVGLIPYGIIVLFGPFLFSFVFGSEWLVAGEYARWIALWSYSAFLNRPSVRSLPVLNAQRFHLIYTIFWTIIKLILLTIGYLVFNSDIIAIALFCLSGVVSNIILITYTNRLCRKRMVK